MLAADRLNILGIAAQLVGFIILSIDLWPEYKKAKRQQWIWNLVGFCRHANALFAKGDARGVFFAYANAKEGIVEGFREIMRFNDNLPLRNPDKLTSEEECRTFSVWLEQHYSEWIDAIQSQKAYRSMHVGLAIAIVIIGYIVQLIAAISQQ